LERFHSWLFSLLGLTTSGQAASGARKDLVTVAAVGASGVGGTGVDLATPLLLDHRPAVDVSDMGTGISFTLATTRPHVSGTAVQALGGGIDLDTTLVTTTGYQGAPAPTSGSGGALSTNAGSIALLDASGVVVVDAMVYGSQQSSSSGNGTITSPELAVMEADQGGGGCIVVVAGSASGEGRSNAHWTDGTDTDSLCRYCLWLELGQNAH
jgi:non-reducing end alpha-L-arabinofuranosidase